MAIVISIEYPGRRGVHRGHYTITAAEICHVRLPSGRVGLNISPERGKARGTLRMESEEARILAAMLIEGADNSERQSGNLPESERTIT